MTFEIKDYFETPVILEPRVELYTVYDFMGKELPGLAIVLDMPIQGADEKEQFATAAELIVERANAEKPHMGLTSWEQYPNGKIQKYDVSIAKNYLSREELQALERIVTMYLDYAEYQAGRHIPMTMQDWSQRLNRFLEFNEHEILHDTGRVTHEIAKAFAESEFEKYRIVQDRMFESDFDHFLALEEQAARKND